MRLFRLAKILRIASRYGLDEMILEHEPSGRLAALSRLFHFWRRFDAPRAVRLRLALESLGPIFVKFGQVLVHTPRPDAARHRRRARQAAGPGAAVFGRAGARADRGRATAGRSNQVFAEFDPVPVASASVAQVHFASCMQKTAATKSRSRSCARTCSGVIDNDVALLDTLAGLLESDLVGRQAAEAARGRRRIRQAPARRARPDARGSERDASCGAISPARSCCWCPKCTGTTARRR